MRIAGSIALVTGANRGLGRAYALALRDACAGKIYAAARDPETVKDRGLIPVRLDVTDASSVASAAALCGDVNFIINNAGISRRSPFLAASSMEAARDEMETNYFGSLAMCRAFAPVLGRNGGGALVNMLSVVSWFTYPFNATQCASKAALRALTNGLRIELRHQRTTVVGVYAGFIETDMAAGVDAPKANPADIAKRVLAGVQAGEEEILADARSAEVKHAITRDEAAFYSNLQLVWDAATADGHSR